MGRSSQSRQNVAINKPRSGGCQCTEEIRSIDSLPAAVFVCAAQKATPALKHRGLTMDL